MKNKLLLVSFPVDLGNRTFEKRFIQLFETELDLKVYRFIPGQAPVKSFTDYLATTGKRFLNSSELQSVVAEAHREDRKVLFHGISPALFAYPALGQERTCIVTDWTRKLYEPINGQKMSPTWLTLIHRQVLNAQKYVLGLTQAVLREMATDYGIPEHKLKKCRLPFSIDLDLFEPSPSRKDGVIKLLFVGGDFERKGGDILLDWFVQANLPNVELTMITGSPPGEFAHVNFYTNIHYGEPQHVQLYKEHDILVLPTKCDSYPSVLGEAACAGLAVLTTQYALGAGATESVVAEQTPDRINEAK
jgi:glycosyltransferase involved in cell wall biosynthesis